MIKSSNQFDYNSSISNRKNFIPLTNEKINKKNKIMIKKYKKHTKNYDVSQNLLKKKS